MADVADREYAGHAGLHRQGRPVERPAGRQASAAGEVRNHRENAKDAHQAYRRSGLQVRRRPRWHSHPGGEAGLAPIKALSYVKRGLEALKIRWIEIEDAKADDVIATPVSRVPAGRDILITSGDRDKYQLVADRVLVLNTAMRPGHRLIGPKQIEARYGVPPSAWCCRTGLAGDPSDGIKGIPGIGPATASASFRAACTSASGRLTGRRGQRILDNMTAAVRCRDLARMRTDIPSRTPQTASHPPRCPHPPTSSRCSTCGDKGVSRVACPGDNPRLCSQVKSERCQQGSRIVSAASAGLRARLTSSAWRASIPLPAMVQTPSAMVV